MDEILGFIITAPGDHADFVSRFFAPRAGVDEDPVTGSAHCHLTLYWSNRLHKKEMEAIQLSSRKGKLRCIYKGDRVGLMGNAVTYMEGKIHLP